MASKGLQSFSRSLSALRAFNTTSKDPLVQCLAPRLTRSMATEAPLPSSHLAQDYGANISKASEDQTPASTVLTTIYKFPEMEPLRFESYDSKHLYLPLRRDILHRAVVYEGDKTRQGTASVKTRWEVHGSHRKIRPQKGTGMARLGTRQSPMLRGGGKSFGPHPRDFATGLPRKMYDLAWRTALSYRYRKGELIVCEDGMDIEFPEGMEIEYPDENDLRFAALEKKFRYPAGMKKFKATEYPTQQYAKQIWKHNGWGGTLLITGDYRENLFEALEHTKGLGKVKMVQDVDVKNLLEMGRVVIEKSALDEILEQHQSDLIGKVRSVV